MRLGNTGMSRTESAVLTITATTCPPTTLLGAAALLWGITKTIKAVDAIATAMAA